MMHASHISRRINVNVNVCMKDMLPVCRISEGEFIPQIQHRTRDTPCSIQAPRQIGREHEINHAAQENIRSRTYFCFLLPVLSVLGSAEEKKNTQALHEFVFMISF